MTGLRWALLAAMVGGSFGSAVAQPTKAAAVHYRITGTVVNDRDGEPIPLCHMSAWLAITPAAAGRGFGPGRGSDEGGFGPRQETIETDADAHGRFTLEVPADGRYRLSASARGFRQQSFEEHGTFSTAVVLTKAAPSHAVVFRASSDAILSGDVTDEAAEPVRQAQVKLYRMGDPARTAEEPRMQMVTMAMTDDRGHYELPSMAAGAYKISVTGRPWYTTPNPPANGTAAPLDPSLDVVYPITWYPNTDDEESSETIRVTYGEKRQLDFRLNAIPSAHLRVTIPVQQPATGGTQQGPFQRMPRLERILPDGTVEGAPLNIQAHGKDGQVDIGGLQPGTYRMSQPGSSPDGPQTYVILHVTAGGVVSESSAGVAEIPVAIRVDGDPTVSANQVSLTDTATGRPVNRGLMIGMPGRGGPNGQGGARQRRGANGATEEGTLQVPPGTYEVTVNARDSFLTGLEATGATVTGRQVKITEGTPHLLVHMAAGMATIEGTATRQGKPSSGAMVVLVPATLGSPASLTFLRRAQTATDGSFVLTNVIPGQYILLAIDHGWDVNWRDPAALRPYLLQGEPLDLAAAATVHPALTAMTP